jgi:protein-disulfide isomerase
MTHLTRRSLILAAAAMALAGPALAQDGPVDLTRLAEAPASGEMFIGPANAKVTIIEYASASCPHCAEFANGAYKDLKKEYIDTGKVRFIFREFPHNQEGLAAFMLARCAPKEKYFPIVETLFEQQQMWLQNPMDGLFKIAQLAGFTKESFDACLKNDAVVKGIVDVRELAAKKFGVQGIPAFFLNGQPYEGETTIEAWREAINPLLG